jgi:hypothetical protein
MKPDREVSSCSTASPKPCPLAPAELEALQAYALHDDFEAAARSIYLTRYALKDHLAQARSRLGFRKTHRAIALAAANHWIDPPPWSGPTKPAGDHCARRSEKK